MPEFKFVDFVEKARKILNRISQGKDTHGIILERNTTPDEAKAYASLLKQTIEDAEFGISVGRMVFHTREVKGKGEVNVIDFETILPEHSVLLDDDSLVRALAVKIGVERIKKKRGESSDPLADIFEK